jgi:hypothetical protein
MLDRIFHHWETTALGAMAAASTVGVSMLIAGSVDRESLYLAMFLAAVGAVAKVPGREDPGRRNSGNPGFDDP